MVIKKEIIKCNCCGKEFLTKYYHGGSIEHENYTNDQQMNIFVRDFYSDSQGNHALFLESIMLDGNFCNFKDYKYDVCLCTFECRIKWLKNRGYIEIANWLESQRSLIKDEFKKICERKITDHEDSIKKLKQELISFL